MVVDCFQLNRGTGGKGRYHGGDGVIRKLLFRKPLTLSVLTERRVHRPYGLAGMLWFTTTAFFLTMFLEHCYQIQMDIMEGLTTVIIVILTETSDNLTV